MGEDRSGPGARWGLQGMAGCPSAGGAGRPLGEDSPGEAQALRPAGGGRAPRAWAGSAGRARRAATALLHQQGPHVARSEGKPHPSSGTASRETPPCGIPSDRNPGNKVNPACACTKAAWWKEAEQFRGRFLRPEVTVTAAERAGPGATRGFRGATLRWV